MFKILVETEHSFTGDLISSSEVNRPNQIQQKLIINLSRNSVGTVHNHWCIFDRIILLCFVTYMISERFIVVPRNSAKANNKLEYKHKRGNGQQSLDNSNRVILHKGQPRSTKTGFKQEPKSSFRSACINKRS